MQAAPLAGRQDYGQDYMVPCRMCMFSLRFRHADRLMEQFFEKILPGPRAAGMVGGRGERCGPHKYGRKSSGGAAAAGHGVSTISGSWRVLLLSASSTSRNQVVFGLYRRCGGVIPIKR